MIKLVLIAHGGLSKSFLETAENLSCSSLEDVYTYSVTCSSDIKVLIQELEMLFLNSPEGVLVLSDIFGGTGVNAPILAAKDMNNVFILSGLNMGMLMSALYNRGKMNVAELAQKAEADGRRAVINATDFMSK
ncbi:PTS system fructose subfamily IIA component [Elusimicrobium minutum Pei191]|uniref:PTS system fructose subfamily IIA component n=1 Tax=Elusimicrobium minutum (strain Pei191) TaxID=445932 RepID=B2KAZ6_ELUMP|nr:PTS fructose subfamily IIA component [Elusimicrobium minutum]ACC97692.1 PTS system fructose subfamily IIA component [Elusimicrobium minutum Pei191]